MVTVTATASDKAARHEEAKERTTASGESEPLTTPLERRRLTTTMLKSSDGVTTVKYESVQPLSMLSNGDIPIALFTLTEDSTLMKPPGSVGQFCCGKTRAQK